MDLPKVVAAVTAELYTEEGGKKIPYAHLRGHDINDDHERGHFTSEWVMVARKADQWISNTFLRPLIRNTSRNSSSASATTTIMQTENAAA